MCRGAMWDSSRSTRRHDAPVAGPTRTLYWSEEVHRCLEETAVAAPGQPAVGLAWKMVVQSREAEMRFHAMAIGHCMAAGLVIRMTTAVGLVQLHYIPQCHIERNSLSAP